MSNASLSHRRKLTRACSALLVWGLACGTTVLRVHVAAAQAVPDAAADESLTQKSRELFAEGNAHAAKGDFVRARAALKAAWGLMHHWGIAANLGAAELELGNHRDAAEMLSYALGNWPDSDWTEERAEVVRTFHEARKHVGAIEVTVDVEGATVLVDDKEVGQAPLTGLVFVEPGKRVVAAKAPRLDQVASTVAVKAGGEAIVSLQLTKADAPADPNPVVVGDESGSAKPIVVGTGAGLTVLAAALGVVYLNKAGDAENKADDLRAQRDATVGPNGCGLTIRPGICDQIDGQLDDRNAASRNATIAWVGAGVLASATLATYFLWPAGEPSTTSVRPLLGRETAFVSLEGRF